MDLSSGHGCIKWAKLRIRVWNTLTCYSWGMEEHSILLDYDISKLGVSSVSSYLEVFAHSTFFHNHFFCFIPPG